MYYSAIAVRRRIPNSYNNTSIRLRYLLDRNGYRFLAINSDPKISSCAVK
jgi:hypothetical protein